MNGPGELLFVPSVLDPIFGSLAAHMQRRRPGLRLDALVFARHGAETLRTGPARWERIFTISEVFAHTPFPPSLGQLQRLEERYGPPNLYLMAAADPFVWGYKRPRVDAVIVAAFALAERALEGVDAVVAEGVDSLPAYAVYAVARARGIPFVVLTATRLPGRITYFRDTWLDEPFGLAENYVHYRAEGAPASSMKAATAFVDDIRRTHRRPEYVERTRPPSIGAHEGLRLVAMTRRWLANRDDYIAVHPAIAARNRLRRIARERIARGMFARGIPDVAFAFFPLHLQPEITTLVYAPFHTDQIAVIGQIAKSLPAGWWLVVKEHPASLGRRPLGFYRELAGIPGVRLLDPAVDSHALVLASRVVVTITGTVGWEAILHRRPVVTLGEVFFNRYAGVRHVPNVRDLPDVLRAVAGDPSVPAEDELLTFVAAVMDSTYPGLIDHPDQNPSVLDPGNVSRLAEVVERALGLT